MATDRDIVQQLQRRLPEREFHNGERCIYIRHGERCIYNEQGQLIELHLCCLHLTEVPPEVWQCSFLQKLFLSYNQLSTLPAELGQLTALQTLDLGSNQLSTLPAEIGQLSALQSLYLGSDLVIYRRGLRIRRPDLRMLRRLSTLPAEMGNRLSTLPAELGQLTALQVLDLSYNRLSTLPAELGQLTALQTLRLYHNRLSTLPAEIGQLSALQVLFLRSNQLSTLPAEIGQLSALQSLYLNGNQLSTLPAELGQLTALQSLDLGSNQLSTLPAELGQLTALQELDLNGNQLSTLPAELGQLTALQELDLSRNQFSTLPAELGQLTALQKLFLDYNHLQSPLPDIIAQGTPAILAYLRMQLPIKIFYCYAHEDRALRDLIDKHLSGLKRQCHVVVWYDREIQAGMKWEREIEKHLSTAHIVLLLVSADFMSSDYCYGKEMQRALEMHKQEKVCVLPILLRPVDWQDAPFAKLQILPTGALPITEWQNQDKALTDVAQQIRVVVTTLHTQQG